MIELSRWFETVIIIMTLFTWNSLYAMQRLPSKSASTRKQADEAKKNENQKDLRLFLTMNDFDPSDVNRHTQAYNKMRHTPLTLACLGSPPTVVQLLIDAKADPNIRAQDAYGSLPLHMVALSPFDGSTRNTTIFRSLMAARAQLDVFDELGQTPLMIAVRNNKQCLVSLILDQNCHIDQRNDKDKEVRDCIIQSRLLGRETEAGRYVMKHGTLMHEYIVNRVKESLPHVGLARLIAEYIGYPKVYRPDYQQAVNELVAAAKKKEKDDRKKKRKEILLAIYHIGK